MTAQEKLNNAIEKNGIKPMSRLIGYTPKHGQLVATAYDDGKITTLIDALYIIAELLDDEVNP